MIYLKLTETKSVPVIINKAKVILPQACMTLVPRFKQIRMFTWGRRGRERMVFRFTTTCAISVYHN